jgi:hypothetical protein
VHASGSVAYAGRHCAKRCDTRACKRVLPVGTDVAAALRRTGCCTRGGASSCSCAGKRAEASVKNGERSAGRGLLSAHTTSTPTRLEQLQQLPLSTDGQPADASSDASRRRLLLSRLARRRRSALLGARGAQRAPQAALQHRRPARRRWPAAAASRRAACTSLPVCQPRSAAPRSGLCDAQQPTNTRRRFLEAANAAVAHGTGCHKN